MFEQIEKFGNPEDEKKAPRYWHRIYAETVAKKDLADWEDINNIEYVGDFTDVQWKDFLKNCRRDSDGEPVISGKKIDKEGNPIE